MKLSDNRLETKFTDLKPALDETEARVEAGRCINCYEAPCINACPTHINIPQYISRIASGNTKGAAKTILDSNILGLSCAQSCPTEVLCEGACVYNALNKKPIQIGKLQRFAVEYAYENKIKYYEPGKASGKKVALIGAGPASLACAHELRKNGHETVIFEKASFPGGLNTFGIAPYKMKAKTSLWEIEQIEAMGVRFEYGKELGNNLKIDDVLKQYDAVFFGMGLGPDSKLDSIDSHLTGIYGAVDFISKMKITPTGEIKESEIKNIDKVKTALVVGGGNTALDACRELKGLGVEHVIIVYRRDEASMSGYKHESNSAKQEDVDFWYYTLPTKFEKSANGIKVTLQKTKVLAEGKVVLSDEAQTIEVQLVLVATGQSKLEKEISAISGLKFEKGKLIVDPKTGKTGHEKIFAGGDLVNGGKEVVNAVAEGKTAAIAMNKMLGGIHHG